MTNLAFALIMSVVIGDPEAGPVHDFVIDYNMTEEDCSKALEQYEGLWLGNPNVGMHCRPSQGDWTE